MMQLNKHIVKKYNRLFREVAGYYDLSDSIILWPFPKYVLSIITMAKLGHPGNIPIQFADSKMLEFVDQTYPYLLPFYKLFLESRKPSASEFNCEVALYEINCVVKEMRNKKKEFSTIRNVCGEIPLGSYRDCVQFNLDRK